MSQIIQSGSACLVMIIVAGAVSYAEAAQNVATSEDNASVNLTESAKNESIELSVAPSNHIVRPESCPDWVKIGTHDFDGDVHVLVVGSGSFDTVAACESKLKELLKGEVNNYIEMLTQSDNENIFPINDEWIETELVTDRYVGTCKMGEADLHEVAVRLEIDKKARQKILRSYQNFEVKNRLGAIGGIVGMGFLFLIGANMFLSMLSRRVQRRQANEYASS